MRISEVLVIASLLAIVGPGVHALASPTGFSLSDETLMTFEDTYVKPYEGWADLVGKVDTTGLGVEYDVALYGAWDIELGIGGPSPLSDLSGFTDYFLTITNTSVDDTFSVNLYMKTGPNEDYYGSPWWTLFPGMTAEVSLNLISNVAPVANLNDVRELGFGLEGWVGNEFGQADAIRVMAADPPGGTSLQPLNAVPEASTLMLFGSGLVGLLAIARKKLPFLSK